MCQANLADRQEECIVDKAEILARSKRENRGQDVASLAVARSSIVFGWIVAVCLLAVVAIAEALVYDRMSWGIFFAVMAGCCAIFVSKYLKLRMRHELFIAIIDAVAAAGFLIAWILQLVK